VIKWIKSSEKVVFVEPFLRLLNLFSGKRVDQDLKSLG